MPPLNPALQVTADRNLRIIDAPIQKPGPEDVLIHIKATGICGYVIHQFKLSKTKDEEVDKGTTAQTSISGKQAASGPYSSLEIVS